MPYVDQKSTQRLNDQLSIPHMETPGELNYVLTKVAISYLDTKGLRYHVLNDIMGAFTGACAEFYRRVVAPYEDKKIAENGDVYK